MRRAADCEIAPVFHCATCAMAARERHSLMAAGAQRICSQSEAPLAKSSLESRALFLGSTIFRSLSLSAPKQHRSSLVYPVAAAIPDIFIIANPLDVEARYLSCPGASSNRLRTQLARVNL